MSVVDKSIKFPANHYVGFQARPKTDEVPLGFMTPDGEDAAAKKRKTTVDNWASGSGYYSANEAKETLPAQTFENKPLTGFRLGRNVRHNFGWGQGNVKWRIEDPRGFELEITSPNLAQLLGFCTIEQGEIQEQCIWARLGAENILVPVNSEVYTNTVRNTERMAKKASLRDLKIGDSAVLQNGEEGTYYGTFYVATYGHYYGDDSNKYGAGNHFKTTGKKRHVFLMQAPKADGVSSTKFFRAVGSPKLSELYEGNSAMTLQEAELEVNRMIQEDGVTISESSTEYSSPFGVSIEPLDQTQFVQVVEKNTISNIVKQSSGNGNSLYNHMSRYNITLSRIADKVCLVSVSDVVSKRNVAPGGVNHNPTYHTLPSYWRLSLNYLDDDIFNETGKVMLQGNSAIRDSWSRSARYMLSTLEVDATAVPDEVEHLRMEMTTATGSKLAFYR